MAVYERFVVTMPEVPDDEVLFRGIRDIDIETHCPRDPVDRVRRISSNAFNDPHREPSVDLGSRCGDDPGYTSAARGPCSTRTSSRKV